MSSTLRIKFLCIKIASIISILVICTTYHQVKAQIFLETKVVGSESVTSIYKYFYKRTPRTTQWWTDTFQHEHLSPNQVKNLYLIENYGADYGDYYWMSATMWTRSKAIMEFNAHSTRSGEVLPTDKMTTYNWKAYLKGLLLEDCEHPGGLAPLKLFDLSDISEDGHILFNETARDESAPIPFLAIIPEKNTMLQPIDVTEALRRDLFFSEANPTSGFMLDYINSVEFKLSFENTTKPYIEIVFDDHYTSDIALDLVLRNHESKMYLSLDVMDNRVKAPQTVRCILVLELFGSYFYYPSWGIDFESFNYDRYRYSIVDFPVLDELLPAGQLTFFAAVINPQTQSIISEIAETTYVWP